MAVARNAGCCILVVLALLADLPPRTARAGMKGDRELLQMVAVKFRQNLVIPTEAHDTNAPRY